MDVKCEELYLVELWTQMKHNKIKHFPSCFMMAENRSYSP